MLRINVTNVKQFGHLIEGIVFKYEISQILASEPDWSFFADQKIQGDSTEKIWQTFTKQYGDVINGFESLKNPLPKVLKNLKISYKTGGIYIINQVKMESSQRGE